MPTIPNKWPRSWRGRWAATCDTCGARYPSHKLVRASDGRIRCIGPGTNNDGRGATAVELDEENARLATEIPQRGHYGDPGDYDFGVEGATDIIDLEP